MLVEQSNQELTPACALGFLDRLQFLLGEGGLHRRGYVAFLAESTGLSHSGARKIISNKRPPKRMAAFMALISSVQILVNDHKKLNLSKDEISRYLLEGVEISTLPSNRDSFDISGFVQQDPIVASQIILKIDETIKVNNVNKHAISSSDIQKIRFRLLSFYFKNKTDIESQRFTDMVTTLIDLAAQKID